MSLFDDLLNAIRAPSRPCLIVGCNEAREADGLCARHNRDVVEPDVLEDVEIP